jgi:hypothetical protein
VRTAFDVLVTLHVVSAVVGFGAVALSGAYGIIAGRDPEEGRRFFSAPARAEYLILAVPVFGAAALAERPGGHDFGAVWVVAGFVIWAAGSAVLLGLVRPAERRIRETVGQARGDELRLAWAAGACDALFVVAFFLMVTQPR